MSIKQNFGSHLHKYNLINLAVLVVVFASIFALTLNLNTQKPSESRASETYKKWEEITFTFVAPSLNLSDNGNSPNNPFLDYRMTVTVSKGAKSFVIPGYFAGAGTDGKGNVWKAHFAADEVGSYNYVADLRKGPNAAVSAGGTAVEVAPSNGTFVIAGESNMGGFYSNCGRLVYANSHYLKCLKTGLSWIKGGTNSPENFMAGADTGNEGNIKNVLDYLGSQKVNSIYFLPMNIGGDANGDTHPFLFNYVPHSVVTAEDLVHYNIHRLDKWNDIFIYAQKKDISLEFVLNETEDENRLLLGENLTNQRKLYYRELVARFAHHPALKWIITEENRFSSPNLKDFANYIKSIDPYDHPIAVHTNKDELGFYEDLKGDASFDATAIQFTAKRGSADNASAFTETWRQKSQNAGRPWVVDMDEAILEENDTLGMTSDTMDSLRRRVLYPTLFSGGNISWYFGSSDDRGMSLGKFQQREAMWKWMWHARKLLYSFPNRDSFRPGDNLVVGDYHSGGKTQVFYDPANTYLVYLAATTGGDNAKLDLSSAGGAQMKVQWFNPRSGENDGVAQTKTASSNFVIGANPKAGSGDREDWVVVISNVTGSTATPVPQATATPIPQGYPVNVRAKGVFPAGQTDKAPRLSLRLRKQSGKYQEVGSLIISNTGFTNYVYRHPTQVIPEELRLYLTNDQTGVDVYLDWVEIGGTHYQAEAANSYSTGNWNRLKKKCDPGYAGIQSEEYADPQILACNGYFQVVVPTTYPDKIKGVDVSSQCGLGGKPEVTISWKSDADASLYTIDYCEGSSCFPATSLDGVPENNPTNGANRTYDHIDDPMGGGPPAPQIGKTYKYRVRARGTVNREKVFGPWSEIKSVTIPSNVCN